MTDIPKVTTLPITSTSLFFSWLLRTRRSNRAAHNCSDDAAVMVDCVLQEDKPKQRPSDDEAEHDSETNKKVTFGCSSSQLQDGAIPTEPVGCLSVPGAFRVSPSGDPSQFHNFMAIRKCQLFHTGRRYHKE